MKTVEAARVGGKGVEVKFRPVTPIERPAGDPGSVVTLSPFSKKVPTIEALR